MRSFLIDRKFAVRVNSSFFIPRSVSGGVPQGEISILSNFYTCYLLVLLKTSAMKYCAFADELKICRSITSDSDIEPLQKADNNVQKWSSEWSLPSRDTRNDNAPHYSIKGTPLNEAGEIKYFGL